MKLSIEQYEALCRLGHTLLTRGQPERAARIFRGLTSLDPDRGDAWRLLGACRERLGDPQGSASAFERALEVDSADAEARVAYAELLANHQRIKDAATVIQPLVNDRRSDERAPAHRRGKALWRRWRGR